MVGDVVKTAYGLISAEFIDSPLADICVPDIGVQTGPFGSQLHASDYVEHGTPIITVEHLGENRIIHSNLPRVTDDDRNRLGRYTLITGDIVFSRVGSVDRRALVHPEEDGWLFSGRCLRVRPDPNKIDPGYLSWFFGLSGFQQYIRQVAVGATMPSLNTRILGGVRIYYPRSLNEQRAIAGVLGALDDKIAQNQRTARALERLVRAVFRSWFVDFEPVKAKADGALAFPSMPQSVFDILPAHFTDSEIGLVPGGWKVRPIGDMVSVKGGGTPSTKIAEYWEEGVHCWATPRDMSRLSHPVLLDTERCITDAGINCISSGLLPPGTVLMSSRAPVGYLAIAGVPTAINQGFIAMVCDGPLPPTYVLQWAYASMDAIQGRASGTTFPEISKKNFRPLPVVVPPPDVVTAFRNMAEPLFELLTTTIKEDVSLGSMRDYLLPRLLSGSVHVEAVNG